MNKGNATKIPINLILFHTVALYFMYVWATSSEDLSHHHFHHHHHHHHHHHNHLHFHHHIHHQQHHNLNSTPDSSLLYRCPFHSKS